MRLSPQASQTPGSRPPAGPRLPPGAALLGLSTLVASASLALALPIARAVFCDRLAPLGVLAALSATLIALCFRALATARSRTLLAAALLLAAVSLFASARFVARYHAACAGVQQQLQQLRRAR
jgi:hypothetical protein